MCLTLGGGGEITINLTDEKKRKVLLDNTAHTQISKNMKISSKTNTNQTPIQKFFHSAQKYLLLASATLLASTLSLEASAFTLRRAEEGNVIGIDNLDIEGEVYNVEFVHESAQDLYGSASVSGHSGHKRIIAGSNPFDFSTKAAAEVAFLAVSEALGSEEFISETVISGPTRGSVLGYEKNDNFLIPFGEVYSLGTSQFFFYNATYDKKSALGDDEVGTWFRREERSVVYMAKFSKAPTAVATPEPSLVLGFITLGGLMLGSKRKTKS